MGSKKIKILGRMALGLVFVGVFISLLTPVFVFAATPVLNLTDAANGGGQPGPCPSFVTSGKYCLLTGEIGGFLPAEINIRDGGLSLYLRKLYQIGVAVATGLALIYITIGGLQYSTTDSITGSSQGRQTITNALVGLLVVLASYVMLNAINPALLNSGLQLQDSVSLGTVSGNTSGLAVVNNETEQQKANLKAIIDDIDVRTKNLENTTESLKNATQQSYGIVGGSTNMDVSYTNQPSNISSLAQPVPWKTAVAPAGTYKIGDVVKIQGLDGHTLPNGSVSDGFVKIIGTSNTPDNKLQVITDTNDFTKDYVTRGGYANITVESLGK